MPTRTETFLRSDWQSLPLSELEDYIRQLEEQYPEEMSGARQQRDERRAPTDSSEYAPSYDYKEGEPFANVARAVGNLPGDVASMGPELYQAVRHPLQTGKAVGQTAIGALGGLQRRILSSGLGADEAQRLMGAPSEAEQMASGAWEGFKESFSPKEMTERPAHALANAFSIINPALRATGAMGALSQAGRAGQIASRALAAAEDPFLQSAAAGAKLGGKMVKGAGRGADWLARVGAQAGTQVDPGVMKKFEDQAATAAGRATLRQTISHPDIAKTMVELPERAVKELVGLRADEFAARQADVARFKVRLRADKFREWVIEPVVDALRKRGIEADAEGRLIFPTRKGGGAFAEAALGANDKGQIQRAFEIIRNLADDAVQTPKAGQRYTEAQIPFEYLYNARHAIDTISGDLRGLVEPVDKLLGEFRAALDRPLKTAKGFAELDAKYAEQTQLIKQFSAAMSVSAKNPDTIYRKMLAIYNEGNPVRQQIVEEVATRTGLPLTELTAGAAFRDPISGSLIGKSAQFGALPSVGAALFAGNPLVLAPAVAGIAISSPLAVGKMLLAKGWAREKVNAITSQLDRIWNAPGAQQLIKAGQAGSTYGQLAARLGLTPSEEEGGTPRPRALLRTMGGIR